MIPAGRRWFVRRDERRGDGRPIAFAGLIVLEGVGYLDHVVTLPDARRRGHAEALTRAGRVRGRRYGSGARLPARRARCGRGPRSTNASGSSEPGTWRAGSHRSVESGARRGEALVRGATSTWTSTCSVRRSRPEACPASVAAASGFPDPAITMSRLPGRGSVVTASPSSSWPAADRVGDAEHPGEDDARVLVGRLESRERRVDGSRILPAVEPNESRRSRRLRAARTRGVPRARRGTRRACATSPARSGSRSRAAGRRGRATRARARPSPWSRRRRRRARPRAERRGRACAGSSPHARTSRSTDRRRREAGSGDRSPGQAERLEHHALSQPPLRVDQALRAERGRRGRQDPATRREQPGTPLVDAGGLESFLQRERRQLAGHRSQLRRARPRTGSATRGGSLQRPAAISRARAPAVPPLAMQRTGRAPRPRSTSGATASSTAAFTALRSARLGGSDATSCSVSRPAPTGRLRPHRNPPGSARATSRLPPPRSSSSVGPVAERDARRDTGERQPRPPRGRR